MEPTLHYAPLVPRHGVPRVLVVDDEVDHAEICAALLQRRGYKVAVAMNGADAVELAHLLKPDLILLDLLMPSDDGVSTAASLRGQPDTRDVPIVFLSACVEAAVRACVRDLGVTGYLLNPFRAAELIGCVERSLGRSR